jgi:apolipoprotein N-acyltransferase
LLPSQKVLFAFLGGILMGLTPAPVNAWYLAWIALVPLWLLIVRQQKLFKQLRQTLAIALAWGFGYHGLALFWITGVHPMTWMGVPWLASLVIAIFCWLFITFWGAALVVCWSMGMVVFVGSKPQRHEGKKIFINLFLRVLLGVALWCILEKLWSYSPLWWSSLAYTQSPHNLAILQWGKISGSTTITAAIVAVNGLLAEAIIYFKNTKISTKTRKIIFLIPLILGFGLHLFGLWMYQLPISEITESPARELVSRARLAQNQAAIKVGIIQGNVPNAIKLYPEGWRRAIEGYTTGYQKLAREEVDIVLTPETALPFYWDNIVSDRSSFYQAVLTQKVPAWVGAFGTGERGVTNSLFTLTGTGKTFSRYDKYKLVPLGEYIPLESIFGQLINRLSPLETNLIPGKPNQIFPTPVGQAIVGICYESAFGEHFRRQAKAGGEFIITASNNAHYSAAMPAQHHAQDVMRAVETDRWSARATNTGYSGIVDPRGRTIWLSDLDRYEIYAGTIYRRQTETLYVRWGDWLIPVLVILGAIFWMSDRRL